MPPLSTRLHLDALADPAISLQRAGRLAEVSSVTSVRSLLAFYRSPAVLWRGFRHVWQYNHRLNRFGSYVRDLKRSGLTGGSSTVGHAGASGSGPDKLNFQDFYTEVRATGVFFQSGKKSFPVTGSEGEDVEIQKRVKVPLDGPLKSCDTFAVLLAGVDMCAEDDADKLQSMVLGVSNWERRGKDLFFTLSGTLNVDCDSLECDGMPTTWDVVTGVLTGGASIPVSVGRLLLAKLNLSTEYNMDVHYLIVGGTARTLNVVTAEQEGDEGWVENEYDWDKRDEVHRSNEGSRNVRFEDVWSADSCTSTLGFGTIATVIEDHEPHMLEWSVAIPDVRTRGRTVEGDVELFLKNWARGMRNAHLPASLLSFRAKGKVRFGAGITLLQFRQANHYREDSHRDAIEWRAAQHDSSCVPAALEETMVAFS